MIIVIWGITLAFRICGFSALVPICSMIIDIHLLRLNQYFHYVDVDDDADYVDGVTMVMTITTTMTTTTTTTTT